MFFYIKFKYPPITQRRLRLSILLLSLHAFLSSGLAASDAVHRPAHTGHPSPLTWQFYHLTVGNFTTSLLAKLKTYMLIPH